MNIITIIKNLLDDFFKKKIHEKIYIFTLYFVYLLYILSFFTNNKYQNYISNIRLYLKYYIIIFLIIKFNPLHKSKCTSFDKFIIFQAAIFLLLTTNIVKYI